MQSERAIRAFLESMGIDEEKAGGKVKESKDPFITISRQYGAGGHELANAILDEMRLYPGIPELQGWNVFDKEICQMVADNPNLRVPLSNLLNEEYLSQTESFLAEVLMGQSSQDAVYRKVFEVIHSLASVGKVILIGRGGSCITPKLPMGVHLRLVSSLETRLRWIMDQNRIQRREAKKILMEKDRGRKKLLQEHFGRDINDPLLYDAVWNTDTVPVEEIAKSAVSLVKYRMESKPKRSRSNQ